MNAETQNVFEAGPMTRWREFKVEAPFLPAPLVGKLFLHDKLGLTGSEISLNLMKPGEGMPFLHRHKLNEEVYLFLEGRGQFLRGEEIIPLQPGTCIRVTPEQPRAWRNNGPDDLVFIVIQARSGTVPDGGSTDGIGVPGKVEWP
jgi:uncharacterized cupin superfamily protein